MNYSISYLCSCKGADGKPLGRACPQLFRKDKKTWNPRHGSAGFATRIPTSGGTKAVKRFGFGSKAEAKAAAEHAGRLLDLAGADTATRCKIGDLIAATKRGAPLPAVEDVARRLGVGADPSAQGLTAGEWLDTWLAGKQRTKRASTVRGYEMHIRVWLKPALGHLPLERMNTSHVEDLLAEIGRRNQQVREQRAAGKALVQIEGDLRAQPRICGPSTQRRILATLRAALNAAVKQRRETGLDWNPAASVELPAVEEAEARRWSPEQAARFIAATSTDPLGLLYRIAVLRGARRGELAGLRWSDADLDRGVLTIRQTLLQLGGKITTGRPKTRAGERLIFLDRETAGLLRAHRETQDLERLLAGDAWEDHGLVFCQNDGRPWLPDHISRRFQRLAAQADVPVVKFHEGGRHTGVSLMHDAEVPEAISMREVGHADRDVHARYTHALAEAHLAAAEQVAELVRKAGERS